MNVDKHWARRPRSSGEDMWHAQAGPLGIHRRRAGLWMKTRRCESGRCTCCDVSSTCKTLDDPAPGLLTAAPADTARSRPARELILLRHHGRSPHSAMLLSPVGEKLSGTEGQSQCLLLKQRDLSNNVLYGREMKLLGSAPRHKQSKSCLGSH